MHIQAGTSRMMGAPGWFFTAHKATHVNDDVKLSPSMLSNLVWLLMHQPVGAVECLMEVKLDL